MLVREAAERCLALVPRSNGAAPAGVAARSQRWVPFFQKCKKAAHARSGDTDGYTRNQEPPHSLPCRQTAVIALAAGLRILPRGLHSRPAEFTSRQILRGYEGSY